MRRSSQGKVLMGVRTVAAGAVTSANRVALYVAWAKEERLSRKRTGGRDTV